MSWMELWAKAQVVRRLQRFMDRAEGDEPAPVFAGTFWCPKCRQERPRIGAEVVSSGRKGDMVTVCATCANIGVPPGLKDLIE